MSIIVYRRKGINQGHPLVHASRQRGLERVVPESVPCARRDLRQNPLGGEEHLAQLTERDLEAQLGKG
jgi:hypothetical protein